MHAGPPIIPLQKDYSSSSLKYRDRENIYGTLPSHSQRDSLYGTTNLYGGASSSNLYQPRRSSQYEIQPPGIPPMGEPPIYEQGAVHVLNLLANRVSQQGFSTRFFNRVIDRDKAHIRKP